MSAPGYFSKKGKNSGKVSSIVATLTTLPSRIKNIEPTIASLCHQTVLPEKILINIPEYSRREESSYVIPDFLKERAGLQGNKVAIVGVHTRVELWEEETWKLYKREVEKNADHLAERLGGIGVL